MFVNVCVCVCTLVTNSNYFTRYVLGLGNKRQTILFTCYYMVFVRVGLLARGDSVILFGRAGLLSLLPTSDGELIVVICSRISWSVFTITAGNIGNEPCSPTEHII